METMLDSAESELVDGVGIEHKVVYGPLDVKPRGSYCFYRRKSASYDFFYFMFLDLLFFGEKTGKMV
jgi:hypothetical protein